ATRPIRPGLLATAAVDSQGLPATAHKSSRLRPPWVTYRFFVARFAVALRAAAAAVVVICSTSDHRLSAFVVPSPTAFTCVSYVVDASRPPIVYSIVADGISFDSPVSGFSIRHT